MTAFGERKDDLAGFVEGGFVVECAFGMFGLGCLPVREVDGMIGGFVVGIWESKKGRLLHELVSCMACRTRRALRPTLSRERENHHSSSSS